MLAELKLELYYDFSFKPAIHACLSVLKRNVPNKNVFPLLISVSF